MGANNAGRSSDFSTLALELGERLRRTEVGTEDAVEFGVVVEFEATEERDDDFWDEYTPNAGVSAAI